ncbi:hypothetical protein GCM10010977_13930 [Citricoccus zhacaiensis]|uniref:Uncharacterized protein n=1 Tax=Citricoccus zhacaiensis TaxID=489142 RepID=A0ABQ2LX01_9MICC|nr:hypothetical protein [Citricoccus zhacaiensis]GGO44158.1 hypothetical protein GCM10010977_13930 [Citricoccus zhacaiensis]
MPQNFGWFAYAPLSGQAFTPPQPLAASPWFAAASAAAIGGLTLVEPRHLGPGAQAAYRITTAAITGAYTAATLPAGATAGMPARYTDGPRGEFIPLGDIGRGSAALAAGGLTLGLAEPLGALDARITDWLTERGVRRPRWWMAGIGVAMVAAGWASDRAEARALQRVLQQGADESTDDGGHGPVGPAVAAVLDALLVPGVPGTEALRIQLQTVEQQGTAGQQDAGFSTDAFLVVHPDTPRITPRTQTWPVKARFQRGEAVFEVELQIHEGRLESLAIMLAEEMYSPESEVDQDEAIDSLTAWPAIEELELVTETADPLP